MLFLLLCFASLGAAALAVGLGLSGAPLAIVLLSYPLGGAAILLISAYVLYISRGPGAENADTTTTQDPAHA